MRSKLVFSLCAVALAALLPGRLPASHAAGAVKSSLTQCCTLQQKEVCSHFHELAECVNGGCVCSPP